ncbi:DUF7453 family protein [Marinobacterium rhizophilum]|uniref:DUF7453 family protein n=1 Tax=Marinobacterium rhizophilum TaxID=420402 RepID=UPI00039CC8DE|nr:choice-of-anchor tandem repeat NxxGxxAF-containing protein [Marinobacterium rhizophilum]
MKQIRSIADRRLAGRCVAKVIVAVCRAFSCISFDAPPCRINGGGGLTTLSDLGWLRRIGKLTRNLVFFLGQGMNIEGLLFFILFSNSVLASDLFEFSKIAESSQTDSDKPFVIIFHYALNNNGDVAFQGRRRTNGTFVDGLYRGDGVGFYPVLEPDETGFPQIPLQSRVGINDNGVVSGLASDEFYNFSVWAITSGGVINTIEGNISPEFTAADINSSGQIASRRNAFDSIIISDGVKETDLGPYARAGGIGKVVVNDVGQAAHLFVFDSIREPIYVYRYESGAAPISTAIDVSDGISTVIANDTIGFNIFGNASLNTGSGSETVGNIMLVTDDGTFTVAGSEYDPFTKFHFGTSLNNNNMVSFIASTDIDGVERQGIFVRAPTDSALVEVVTEGDSLNGLEVTRFSGLDTEALNEVGQIAFVAWLSDGSRAVYRADPKQGVMPGRPVIPDLELGDGRGFPMPIPMINFGGHSIRTYFDPPIAVGYHYTVNELAPSIDSILINAPLPGGDHTFNLHFEGQTHTLSAMIPFYFSDFIPGGVRSFTLDGIEESEMLDPNSPLAFVTGLTFVDTATEGSILTMTPIIIGDEEPDTQPPVVESVYTSINPVEHYTSFYINAVVDDSGTGSSIITGAEYTINSGSPVSMNAFDGVYDSDIETVFSTIVAGLESGVHSICVTGTDDAELVSTSQCTFLAVFDPSGGFVTGGGWIDSPEGSYLDNPGLTGTAEFGFVTKYKKGASVPDGDTEFNFETAGLRFYSDDCDWLVVSGSRAQFKGTGTINGEGNYGFMITVIDEALSNSSEKDRFRIKIWNKEIADSIVYDNQVGNDDASDPTTDIGGGSIVIHKPK